MVEIKGYTGAELSSVKFLLDADVFDYDEYCVNLSMADPNGRVKEGSFYVWAGKRQPASTPTPAPTAVPTDDPDASVTPRPTMEPGVAPSMEPGGRPTAKPTVAAPVQAWTQVGDQRVDGALEDMLTLNSKTIYITTARIIVMDGGNAKLSGKTLLPDPDVFGDDYVVRISGDNEDVSREESLFVWVEEKGETEAVSITLTVDAQGYEEGVWCSAVPIFRLSTSPALTELSGDYVYAVSVNHGAAITLSDRFYFAEEEGAYTVCFMVIAPDGSVAARSDIYSLCLDFTAPLLQLRNGNGSLQITAGDSLSGIRDLSMDGGATWIELTPEKDGTASYTYKVTGEETFARGMIMVRDWAGGTTVYDRDVTVKKTSMNRGGGNKRATTHAASTEDNVTPYNGVELVLQEGSMTQLTFGEEKVDLTLNWLGEEPLPEEEVPCFTARFTDLDQDGERDTLVLTAVGVSAEHAKDYAWAFTGLVCKKLSASGIDYLMLRSGEQITVLATAGFTGGIRYNMFRTEGMVSKDFSYTLTMDMEEGLKLAVTVGEETYPMSEDTNAEMYYYDLFYGDWLAFEEKAAEVRSGVMQ